MDGNVPSKCCCPSTVRLWCYLPPKGHKSSQEIGVCLLWWVGDSLLLEFALIKIKRLQKAAWKVYVSSWDSMQRLLPDSFFAVRVSHQTREGEGGGGNDLLQVFVFFNASSAQKWLCCTKSSVWSFVCLRKPFWSLFHVKIKFGFFLTFFQRLMMCPHTEGLGYHLSRFSQSGCHN